MWTRTSNSDPPWTKPCRAASLLKRACCIGSARTPCSGWNRHGPVHCLCVASGCCNVRHDSSRSCSPKLHTASKSQASRFVSIIALIGSHKILILFHTTPARASRLPLALRAMAPTARRRGALCATVLLLALVSSAADTQVCVSEANGALLAPSLTHPSRPPRLTRAHAVAQPGRRCAARL